MAKTGPGPGGGGGGGGKTTQLNEVVIKAKPIPRQDSTVVGGVKQSLGDVAKAVASLNKKPTTAVGGSPFLAGKNETTDNINMMIAKRNQLKGSTPSGTVAPSGDNQ